MLPALTMTAEANTKPDPRLTLHSRLDDLSLVWPWVDALGAEYAISAQTLFAIHLCLEEALSNIIRHGYLTHTDKPITVECKATAQHNLLFTIEDQAPPFDPAAATSAEEAPPPSSIDELKVGGRGINLLRKFAGSLAYERLADGNRLTIGFTIRG